MAFCLISMILLLSAGGGLSIKMLDLTHRFDNDTMYWPGRQKLVLTESWTSDFEYQSIKSNAIVNIVCTTEHGGTHIDAPSHFFYGMEGIWNVDEIPIERLIAPAVVVDITEKAKQDLDAEVLVEDLLDWEKKYGKIPDGAVVLMNSGWADHWPDESLVFGTDMKSTSTTLEEKINNFHYPGISPDASQWLLDNRQIYGVGVDTVSLDNAGPGVGTHILLLRQNIFGLEFVHNLGKIPPAGATIYVIPPKIYKSSGAPVRLLAVWDEESPLQWRVAGADSLRSGHTLVALFLAVLALVGFGH